MIFSTRFLFLTLQTVGWSFAQSPGVVGPIWTASPFHPPAIPLAVRSPYLSCWAQGGNGSQPISNQWPTLWDMSSILGWAIFVRVDGVAYRILGEAPLSNTSQVANQTGFSFSATQSKFVHTAGDVMITTNFISPIEPTDLVMQSLPATYLSISTQSMDGDRHRIQVYSDISAEWISGDDGLTAQWSTNISSSSVIHSVQLQTPQPFAVVKNHIQDATAYYGAMSGSAINGSAITWQTSADVLARGQFMSSGQLTNTSDTNFRAVSDDFPVFAISMDLGTIANSNGPVVFALGLIRDPAILSPPVVGGPSQERSLYFFTQFPTAIDAMNHFMSDFPRAAAAAISFDSSIRNAAVEFSTDYADLVDLSTRQVFGMVEITAGKDANGNLNESDVQAFMTDSGGGVNTVDVMFPAFPLFLQTNPVIAGALLTPLLEWQQANGYPNPWAAHDLGTQYPNALGDTTDLAMPVEESANMLIMTLAQARASGDATLVSNYYSVLDKWAQYLLPNAMNPGDQAFTDSVLTGPVVNDTNLALKGILGIQAMAGIASAANNSDAATTYSGIASSLLDQWQAQAFTPDGSHLVLNLGNGSSSLGLPYNLYADKLLGFNMVPQDVYDKAAAFVVAQTQTYGVALDSRSLTASKTDWTLFTAAVLNDTATRNVLISSIRSYAANQLTHVPFSDYYDVSRGTSISFQARPVQGAMYSLLALQVPSKPIVLPPFPATATATTSVTSTTSSSLPNSTHVGAAVSERRFNLLRVVVSIAFVMAAGSTGLFRVF